MTPIRLVARSLLLALFCSITTGCQVQQSPLGQSLSGSVVVEGQPLRLGLLTLTPLGSTKGPKIAAGITDGQFDIAADRGPWPGEYQAMITATPPDVEALVTGQGHEVIRQKAAEPYRVIDRAFNTESTLRVTIQSGNENHSDFQVRWAPTKR
jgi:hypothetical protein